jgi:two-component system sensor histidine kinase/response regulator
MENFDQHLAPKATTFQLRIKKRSDKLMNYFVMAYFVVGLALAGFYSTWFIAISIGSLSLIAYYSVKLALPHSNLYQYVLSAIFGIFMAQFIYQLHGMFEMHFFAFIGSAILITYQKWKLQLPILFVVLVHHALFSYLQNSGVNGVYFSAISDFDLQTFLIHISLTAIIFFICGLWAFQLSKYNDRYLTQALKLIELQKEVELSTARRDHAEVLKKLNQNLEIKAKELSFSNQELEQFAYVASHDLQEPLRTITSFLKLLQDRYELLIDEKGKQYIHFASDGAQRMRQIIHDLLEFSKAGKIEDKRELINVQQIVDDILSLFNEQIRERKARIEMDELPSVLAFKAPIRQVFQNLIENALKYQHEGVTPIIYISCKDKGSYWQFGVADNGIGIPEDQLEQVFIIFRRLSNLWGERYG